MKGEKALRDFESAVRMHEMKGTFHPDDWEEIEQQYKDAKKKMRILLELLNQHSQEQMR